MDNLTPITREEMLLNDEPLTPITREEKILAGEDLNPVTRREYFLKKYRHAGGDVMVEGLSVTENGTYTAPEGKAYSPVEVNVPLPENAYLLKEASGSLVSFSDGADLPMPSFICNIDAVQDLHGQDAPWVGGVRKNKLPLIIDQLKTGNVAGTWSGNTYTYNGIVYTVLTDNNNNITGINANGTTTEVSFFNIDFGGQIPVGDYYANGGANGGGYDTYDVYFYNTTSSARMTKWDGTTPSESLFNTTTSAEIRVPNTTDALRYRIRIRSGVKVENITFYPMIRLATETATTFAPYSNICPISGHTGVDAWVRGKNLLPNNLASSVTLDGITATKDDDGVITLTGQGNGSVNPFFYLIGANGVYPLLLKAGQYTLSQGVVLPTNSMLRVASNNATVAQCQDVGSVSFTLTDDTYVNVYIRVDKNADFTTPVKVYPLICITSNTEYEPYNPNSQNIQVSWQTEAGEVFGGYIDLVSGVLTVTHKSKTGFTRGSQDSSNKLYAIGGLVNMKKFTASSTISPYFIDSMFEKMSLNGARATETPSITQVTTTLYVGGYIGKAAELDTLLESLQVKYELATPITYQLTPTQIKSLLGNNNAWCSTGDVDIDYFAKEV